MPNKPTPLQIAVRPFPFSPTEPAALKNPRKIKRPKSMLVFDTETRTDETQRLMFGGYQFIVQGRCLEEGLFHADDLSAEEMAVLVRYVAQHESAARGGRIVLLPLKVFLKKLYTAAYKGRCLVVGFNLPFDLSRIAHDWAPARGRFAGGFSLGLWSYKNKDGQESRNQYRPRVGIKHIDSKRALKGFTRRIKPDDNDLIPEGSGSGKPEKDYAFRGHFLDLRTLTFAMTDRGYSLEAACEAFGVEHGKQSTTEHGTITEAYIDYNRRDVQATAELAAKLLEEYDRHPIELQETKAYSPASVGKAYLRAMGVVPILERQPDFPKQYLGFAQSAFFGGRTSAHIRKVSVPVAYTDFLSMYPTVNTLMGLWRFVIAREVRVIEHCAAEVETWLKALTVDRLFDPVTWKKLTVFVKVVPDGDILPARAKYNPATNDWQVGVNHLYAEPGNALWLSLPDVAASVVLPGRVPKIVDAFRIEPVGTQKGLRSIKLRGAVEVDPAREDFFKRVIEERKLLETQKLPRTERDRLGKFLKVLANATSYGIYAEMNRQESERAVNVKCFGIDAEPFTCRVAHPDVPGAFCFPPMASLITGAARLMLALLEHSVAALGGTYAMEDTDSMAVVAMEKGGLVPCPGGPLRLRGREAVRALSWKQVDEITAQFSALNPYDRPAIPGSVLKIEDDNFEPNTKKQRQLYCLAISAKRYALFLKDRAGKPILLRAEANNEQDKWSEHGLGHLLNPTDPKSEDRAWIGQIWLAMIRRSLGLPTEPLAFEHAPAVGRVSVSSPALMKPLTALNKGKRYSDCVKPFNFLLTAHVQPFGHPAGADPKHFHLIAPYQPDSRRWLKLHWIDQYMSKRHRIATTGHGSSRGTARVKTYGDIAQEYEFHAEPKCADASGRTCGKQTVGLLQRRHIRVDMIRYIGKESNSLEAVEAGMERLPENVYTEYPDKRRDEWETTIRPALRKVPIRILIETTGMSRSSIMELRAGRSRPRARAMDLLKTTKLFGWQ